MKITIRSKILARLLFALLLLLLLFHLLVIFRMLSSDFLWGGRAPDENLIVLEVLSVFIILVFILVTWLKIRAMHKRKQDRLINVFLWIMSIYFFLNTFGNLASMARIETWILRPLSLIMALLALRIALDKNPEAGKEDLDDR